MANTVNGNELLVQLKKTFAVSRDSELVKLTGYSQSRLTQLKSEKLSPKAVSKLIKRSSIASAKLHAELIRPIVELFPVDKGVGRNRSFIDLSLPDRNLLKAALEKEVGIYAFYNSELEVVYVGQTQKNFWDEMKQTFNRKMTRYKRYQVKHSHGKYSAPQSGIRKMKSEDFHFFDAAEYFSAYVVPIDFIDIFETMLIRVFSNDLINVQMAGNSSLVAYSPIID